MKKILTLLLSFVIIAQISAHEPDASYLYFRIYENGMGGRVEMTGTDINKALSLGVPGDDITVADVTPHLQTIYEYLEARVDISYQNSSYKIKWGEPTALQLDKMDDFIRFNFDLEDANVVPPYIDVKYNVLLDKVSDHKGIMIMEYNWKAGIMENEALISDVFAQGDGQKQLDLTDASLWKGFVALVKLGIWHIWIGLDHILFIVALILPSVVFRRKDDEGNIVNEWLPEPKFKSAFIYIVKIATFFTIAHSITLALGALQLVDLPSRFVESIIALSIALAALHNIIPIFKNKEYLVAFIFGLFHGFGFASVLGDKGLGGDFLVLSLLGFNVGVELGQLAIIIAVFPLLFMIRKLPVYSYILKWGSVLLIFISLYWCIERGFEVDLPLGAWLWKIKAAILG